MSFSALQRAENSSTIKPLKVELFLIGFSALQRAENSSIISKIVSEKSELVSVLFSEPKIPQLAIGVALGARMLFQCSSASRKFLNDTATWRDARQRAFQCSSASRKFLNPASKDDPISRKKRVSVLFSEPKIPQRNRHERVARDRRFQCSSASRKFLNLFRNVAVIDAEIVSVLFSEPKIPQARQSHVSGTATMVSVLFSEPKIPQRDERRRAETSQREVSVLFSEPKIPQSFSATTFPRAPRSFSALQRAENSSSVITSRYIAVFNGFQCSSASRKFLNPRVLSVGHRVSRFSALQRAENSSIPMTEDELAEQRVSVLFSEPKIPQPNAYTLTLGTFTFQCSSASRKFLNGRMSDVGERYVRVSVLFSEPKIPQAISALPDEPRSGVSVLFSEPKIPQIQIALAIASCVICFSALQRAENSSICVVGVVDKIPQSFSALQRAENSSTPNLCRSSVRLEVSVLFSEPKIPQVVDKIPQMARIGRFSALQRAENSSSQHFPVFTAFMHGFQCSSASRKFLNLSRLRITLTCSSFSALQRAENSSTHRWWRGLCGKQCFSALQRAENSSNIYIKRASQYVKRFSALQRAENSSMSSSN